MANKCNVEVSVSALIKDAKKSMMSAGAGRDKWVTLPFMSTVDLVFAPAGKYKGRNYGATYRARVGPKALRTSANGHAGPLPMKGCLSIGPGTDIEPWLDFVSKPETLRTVKAIVDGLNEGMTKETHVATCATRFRDE